MGNGVGLTAPYEGSLARLIEGSIVGLKEGIGVGLFATYVGDNEGDKDGNKDVYSLGAGVRLPDVYVGDKEGNSATCGVTVGELVGSSVGTILLGVPVGGANVVIFIMTG